MNPTDLSFWLSWYDSLDEALGRAEGSITAYKDPEGRVRHATDEEVLPILHEIKELFLRAATVEVFRPRAPSGTQVWPANWGDTERGEVLIRLVEEPAYIAQGQGFRTDEPEAPTGVGRLIGKPSLRKIKPGEIRQVSELFGASAYLKHQAKVTKGPLVLGKVFINMN